MASSSPQRGAASAAHLPDQLAAFYKLVDKTVIAGALCRHARTVELSSQAAVLSGCGRGTLQRRQPRGGEPAVR